MVRADGRGKGGVIRGVSTHPCASTSNSGALVGPGPSPLAFPRLSPSVQHCLHPPALNILLPHQCTRSCSSFEAPSALRCSHCNAPALHCIIDCRVATCIAAPGRRQAARGQPCHAAPFLTPAACTWRACPRVDTPGYMCALMARAGVSFLLTWWGSAPTHTWHGVPPGYTVARGPTSRCGGLGTQKYFWRPSALRLALPPHCHMTGAADPPLYVIYLDAAPVIDGRSSAPLLEAGHTHASMCAFTLDLYLSASLLAIPCRTYLPTFAPSSSPLV